MSGSKELKDFTNWWWRSQAVRVPADPFRVRSWGCEFILYRDLNRQTQQITIFPDHVIPPHCHPDVETFECTLTGGGVVIIGGRTIPPFPSTRMPPRWRRVYIAPGEWHSGVGKEVTVVLSFQIWKDGVEPTFLSENWVGEPCR